MDIGTIQSVDIDEQMRTAYLDYAMSVIVARALPDARDGLKPVHRRILYAMHEMGIRANTSYKKSARIVGEVLGKFHPHGDMAVYDAMARLAQDFSMRYLLVDGQGNFGSVDGDPPAAMRYTEARMGAMAEEMLVDIEKDTVAFTDNFDGSLQEPTVLPSRLPNLLLNGSAGIAVGMATNIPPHNLRELTAAINYVIDNYDEIDEIAVDDLLNFVPGPDFPTGGVIIGREGIISAYTTGRGRIVLRGQAHVEELRGGRYSIVVTEIPYQINKTTLIERIADLARSGRIDAITDLRDEFDRRGMSIVIELKRGAQPKKVLNQLFKYTPLQSTFGVHLLALVNNEPRLLTLKRSLQIFVEHRKDVIVRRSQFELDKARRRAHILDGLLIALANLDDVIYTIRNADDADDARQQLMERFKLSEPQAQAILDLQLRRLAALERQKIEAEQSETMERIAYLEDLLASPKKILSVIRSDLDELSKKYGDERRTHIAPDASENFDEEDLVEDEPAMITITQKGYIKRVSPSVYRTRGRGGKGINGQTVREEDAMQVFTHARTLNTILFFSDKGKVYSEKVYQIPDASRIDKGVPIVNVLSLGPNEHITAALAVPDFASNRYLVMATANGRIKRVSLDEFSNVRNSGLIAINLDQDDELCWVRPTTGKDDVLLVTRGGKALRISEQDVRPMGRPAAGVISIRLQQGDKLTSMEVIEPDSSVLIVTDRGYGKRTDVDEYPVKGRATGGVLTISKSSLDEIGEIAAAKVVKDEDEVMLISANGMVLRLRVKDISKMGRATRGVRMMNLDNDDFVAGLAVLSREDENGRGNGDGSEVENGKGSANGDGSEVENGNSSANGNGSEVENGKSSANGNGSAPNP